jgi:hypothetical protein
MFPHYRVIFRELVFITSPNYIRISIVAVGNTIKINKIFKTYSASTTVTAIYSLYVRPPHRQTS